MCNLKNGEQCECGTKIINTAERVEIVEKKVDSITVLMHTMKSALDDLVNKHKKENEELFNNMKDKLNSKDQEIKDQREEIKQMILEKEKAEEKRIATAKNRLWSFLIPFTLLIISLLASKFW